MIIKEKNNLKLHEEFVKNGIKPFPVYELENGDGDFTFPKDTDMLLVEKIINEHNPIPKPEPISEIQKLWDMIDYLVNSSYEV